MEKHILINNLWSRIYLPKGRVKEVVIGVHGFAGDKESSVLIQLANNLVQQNIALVSFDLPCHGENDNSKVLRLTDCLESVETIFNYVKQNYANLPISVFATSFGGYLVLNHLSKHNENLHKLILRAPAIHIYKVLVEKILPEHNFTKSDLSKTINLGYSSQLLVDNKFVDDLENNSLENAIPTNNFIYVMQGKKDDVVNPEGNKTFFEKHYSNKHKFIYFENADHRFKNPGELDKIISDSMSIITNE